MLARLQICMPAGHQACRVVGLLLLLLLLLLRLLLLLLLLELLQLQLQLLLLLLDRIQPSRGTRAVEERMRIRRIAGWVRAMVSYT